MKRDRPADSRLVRVRQGFVGVGIALIVWLLMDTDGWQFATGVLLIVIGVVLAIALEVQLRRRRAAAP